MYAVPDALPPPQPPPPTGDGGGSDGRGGSKDDQELQAALEALARMSAREKVEEKYAKLSQEQRAHKNTRTPFSGEHGANLTKNSTLNDYLAADAKNAAENLFRAEGTAEPIPRTPDGRVDLESLPNQEEVQRELEDAFQEEFFKATGQFFIRGAQ